MNCSLLCYYYLVVRDVITCWTFESQFTLTLPVQGVTSAVTATREIGYHSVVGIRYNKENNDIEEIN